MSQNHYTSKSKRRPRNKNRRDWTRPTMLALRSPEKQFEALARAQGLSAWYLKLQQEGTAKKTAKARRWS